MWIHVDVQSPTWTKGQCIFSEEELGPDQNILNVFQCQSVLIQYQISMKSVCPEYVKERDVGIYSYSQ